MVTDREINDAISFLCQITNIAQVESEEDRKKLVKYVSSVVSKLSEDQIWALKSIGPIWFDIEVKKEYLKIGLEIE